MANDRMPSCDVRSDYLKATSYATLFPEEDPELSALIDGGMTYEQAHAVKAGDIDAACDYNTPMTREDLFQLVAVVICALIVAGVMVYCWWRYF